MVSRILSHSDYTVAWICALPIEMVAVKALLDEIHSPLPQSPTDWNIYTLGRLSGHNLVIGCLPSGVYGTTSATSVVIQMLRTFHCIRFGLMVGIGGGVPDESHGIRLGDVIVSTPTAVSGGVIQYDYGKKYPQGYFRRTGSLNKPPQILLNAVTVMRCDSMLQETKTKIGKTISDVLQENWAIEGSFFRPENDCLFHSTYEHQGGAEGCSSCDKSQLVQRAPRANNEPHIHYGLWHVLCFEMEAAGLMDQLPCLVIRGICDYSDSHKHKEWQGYAALAAVAYTKTLLSIVPLAEDTVLQEQVSELTEKEKACLANLFITDPEEDMNALKRRKGSRTSGTCSWFLESDELKSWFRRAKAVADIDQNVLWLYGNPGIGKSTMAMMLVEELPKKDYFSNGTNILSFFFCESSSEYQRKATSILRGLLYQIIKQYPPLMKQMMSKYDVQGERLFTSFDALWAVLMDIERVSNGPEIYCIVDALDECEAESQEILLQQIYQSFSEARTTGLVPSNVHMLIISRPYPELEGCLSIFRCLDLGSCKEINNDLKAMVRDKVKDLAKRGSYPTSIALEVSQTLEKKADGTFLWVGIACEELRRVQSRNAVKTLQALPRGLHSLYQTLLGAAVTSVAPSNPDDYLRIKEMLKVVTFALRPLTIMEIAEACRFYLDEDISSRIQFTREIIDLCRLLIVVDNGYVRLLHRSVQEFLIVEMQEINAAKSNDALSSRCIEVILRYCRPDLDRSMLEPNHGFLGYSVLHWPEHASLAQTEFTIRDEHQHFFQNALGMWRCWLDNYNYLKKHFWGSLDTEHSAIHVAARWGIISLISSFQERLEDKDAHGQSPLLIAAKNNQIQAMRLLLESGACVDSLNNQHQNVLHVICMNSHYNNYEMTKFLLDKGASPYIYRELAESFLRNGFNLNARIRRRLWPGRTTVSKFAYGIPEDQEEGSRAVESGLTPLYFSALNACPKMTALLLQCGADPNARSDFGDTALHLAIRGQLLGRKCDDVWETGRYAVESLRELITSGTSSEASDFNRAIDQARKDIVETLLKSQTINVNLANDQGQYPQHVIHFRQGYALSTLEKLVAKGADTSRLNRACQTCLHLASKEGNLEVVRKLVDEGHDILLQDVDGLSPFHYALMLSKVWHSLDHFGRNPLHHHVSSVLCSAEVVEFLVQLGCDVNEFDKEGNSSLGLYVGSFHLGVQSDIFFLLIRKGADLLWVNGHRQNLAHLFMHHREADSLILKYLFDHNLDPTARDLDGKSFMHHGAIHGVFTKELVEFLKREGVLDLHATDSIDKTPLNYAEEKVHSEQPDDSPLHYDPRWKESFRHLNAIS
ncbi:ankyrin [Aspergillus cavernicola]|uniref:Ankyrin n=1 Tax=Aspergillus cavernicola TaxID=176166 RepID=A0ABR4HHS3_9EURO